MVTFIVKIQILSHKTKKGRSSIQPTSKLILLLKSPVIVIKPIFVFLFFLYIFLGLVSIFLFSMNIRRGSLESNIGARSL